MDVIVAIPAPREATYGVAGTAEAALRRLRDNRDRQNRYDRVTAHGRREGVDLPD
jgi:hypothetical protein